MNGSAVTDSRRRQVSVTVIESIDNKRLLERLAVRI
jgi:hypothetical protein